MFLFYSIWGFFYIFLNLTHNFLENFFFIRNNPFLLRKRTFKYISYFEKLLLILFYKKGWFEKSIANLYRKKDVLDYRQKFYPIINSFHLKLNKVYYNIDDLKFFCKQFNYYKNNLVIKKKFLKILNTCFAINNKNFVKFLMLQNLYINNYFNFNSYFFFEKKDNLNIIKMNKLFNIFLLLSSKKLILFNLDKWYDWYCFNFNNNNTKIYCNLKIKLTRQQKTKIKNFKEKKIFKWINIVFKYKKRINNFYLFYNKKFKGIVFFKFNYISFFKVKINEKFKKLMNYYIIKFSESSINKFINNNFLKNYNIQYLRKNRIFNKGRYSRNRQLYRTGVYWCLWLNIIMVYGLYFMFYRFSFNFGYFWWGLLVLAYSTIFSRILKYNFFNINYLYKEFYSLVNWYGFLIFNFSKFFENFLKKYFLDINLINYISKYKNNSLAFFYDNYYYYFVKYFKNFIEKRKRIKMVFIWQGMKEKDNSFLRYKTVLHWIKELYRLIIT